MAGSWFLQTLLLEVGALNRPADCGCEASWPVGRWPTRGMLAAPGDLKSIAAVCGLELLLLLLRALAVAV